ncbi:MAG: DinB family protein [Parvularculaceae bacterium]
MTAIMASPDPINTHCPWSDEPASPDAVAVYRGLPVAFCNPGCRDKFNKAVTLFDECIDATGGGSMKISFTKLAEYNCWMNDRLLACIASLPDEALWQDRGAFFKSILGTLNHLLVWDITWLQRFEKQFGFSTLKDVIALPAPTAHDQILHQNRLEFASSRQVMDQTIVRFITETRERDYAQTLTYTISSGDVFHKNFGGVLQHLFNHQTHHRGQVTTLLSQAGIDPGPTDLLVLLPEENLV